MSGSSPLRVLVLFGGRSAEHEISCLSARNVVDALDPDRYRVTTVGITRDGRWTLSEVPEPKPGTLPRVSDDADSVMLAGTPKGPRLLRLPEDGPAAEIGPVDVCFPVLHGPYGEDGTVQGLLASMGVPYVGADVGSSAVGMDKVRMKRLFGVSGLPQTAYETIDRVDFERDPGRALDTVEAALPYPIFSKPARQGSSIGISRCGDRGSLAAGITEALEHDRVVVLERGLTAARELECGVLGNVDVEVTPPGEVITGHDFYDFEGKYLDDAVTLMCPAEVDDAVRRRCSGYARQAYEAIGARGMARVDFFYVEDTGEVLVNEINTIPGFTEGSMFPRAWAAEGLDNGRLVDRLLELALAAAETDARFAP